MAELAARAFAPGRMTRLGNTGRLGASMLLLVLLGVGFADVFNNATVSFPLALAGGLA
ncbi:MAG: hypothetical protein QOG40_1207, partial [Solirubrobacteraceae bacterium]|nr:hypothetical protein [Solirubrobacteraceae bacterium]